MKPKFTSEFPKWEVANHALWKKQGMVLYVTCIATTLWRHSDSGVTKSPQNMNANMFKWETIWIVRFVKCVSMDFNEIYVDLNKNSGSIL